MLRIPIAGLVLVVFATVALPRRAAAQAAPSAQIAVTATVLPASAYGRVDESFRTPGMSLLMLTACGPTDARLDVTPAAAISAPWPRVDAMQSSALARITSCTTALVPAPVGVQQLTLARLDF
jgi:hypothetical protein